jgi:uncharacterized protein (TIGR03085 family)
VSAARVTRHPLSPPLSVRERRRLADLLTEVGPDQPTLCTGWTTRDLAAHLVVRERRPDTAVALVLPRLESYRQRVQAQAAAQPWSRLLDTLRAGPPPWSPMAPARVDRLANTLEFFVHHEDVRRAAPGWQPRQLEPDELDELWALLRNSATMLYRRVPVGVRLRRTDGGEVRARTVPGRGTVELVGEVPELVLHAFGRGDHALIRLDGDAQDVAALNDTPLSL